ncbi:hypothetical protein ASE33_05075 [Pseudomonas sp. Root9]|nr:hypothetical protein ASE33_05075 [Pseudomonas sp. Root9]
MGAPVKRDAEHHRMHPHAERGNDQLWSELAREKPEAAAYILDVRIIVDVFREQARSYRDQGV